MGFALQTKLNIYPIGSSGFLNSFYSTVTFRLEEDGPGTRFPLIHKLAKQGELVSSELNDALNEITIIAAELSVHPPSHIIWNIDDLSEEPPWGDCISDTITNLSEYFVTSDGHNFIERLVIAIYEAMEKNETVQIVPY